MARTEVDLTDGTSPAQIRARVVELERRAHELPRNESTSELVRRLIDDVQALLDKQIALAKQEIREDIHQLIGAAKALGIGAALLFFALLSFFNFVFLGIDTLIPRWGWLAALIATVVFGIAGGILAMKGKNEVQVQPLARTRETLKEDAEWAKHPLTSNGTSSASATTSPRPSRS